MEEELWARNYIPKDPEERVFDWSCQKLLYKVGMRIDSYIFMYTP
jgi:hypothetical protein